MHEVLGRVRWPGHSARRRRAMPAPALPHSTRWLTGHSDPQNSPRPCLSLFRLSLTTRYLAAARDYISLLICISIYRYITYIYEIIKLLDYFIRYTWKKRLPNFSLSLLIFDSIYVSYILFSLRDDIRIRYLEKENYEFIAVSVNE